MMTMAPATPKSHNRALALGEIPEDSVDYAGDAIEVETVHLSDATPPTGAGVADTDASGKKKRRRGRRGGRGRRRKGAPAAAGTPFASIRRVQRRSRCHHPPRHIRARTCAAISAFAASSGSAHG